MVKLLFLALFGTLTATGMEGSLLYWRPTTGGVDEQIVTVDDVSWVSTTKPTYEWGFWAAGQLTAPTECHQLELYGLSIDQYWSLRFRFTHTLSCGSASALHLSAAVRYSSLSSFQGAGPEMGFAADAKLWRQLRFKGSISAAALIGERKWPAETTLVPMLETRFGALATRSLCWGCLEGELGWALDSYWGTDPFGFAGPYATLRGQF